MNAAMEDHSVVVALLLAHGADPNKHDNVRNRSVTTEWELMYIF